VADANDAFPNDPAEWADADSDGIGDNADTDDNGNGIPDAEEGTQQQPQQEQPQQEQPQQQQQQLVGSSEDSQTVNSTTTTKQSSATFASATLTKTRNVLVRGKILVKSRNGLAQSAAACKGGGKVRVTLKKAGKVVGSKLVKLSRTCSFRAPVTLAKGTTGKLKVEVKFLGNRALKPTKRTTSLQVNG
jgi:hypothetical protein